MCIFTCSSTITEQKVHMSDPEIHREGWPQFRAHLTVLWAGPTYRLFIARFLVDFEQISTFQCLGPAKYTSRSPRTPSSILKFPKPQSVLNHTRLTKSNMGQHMSCLSRGRGRSTKRSKPRKSYTPAAKAQAYRNAPAQSTTTWTASPSGASATHSFTYLNPDPVSMCTAASVNLGKGIGFATSTDCFDAGA